jgi:hypothetical protein
MAPGTVVRRTVEISNSTHSTADVAVYAAGARIDHGSFAFAPGGSQDELSSWTSVSRGALRLRPGTKASETVSIDVPKKASPAERYAVVWAQVSAPAAGGVTLVNRVGVRMYVSVGAGGSLPQQFAIGAIVATRSQSGRPSVVAEVHNIGRGTLEVSGTLTLSDGPGGISAGPFSLTLGAPLVPGSTEPAKVQLGKAFPDGPWRAEVRLSSGFLLRSVAATITFPAELGTAPAGSHVALVVGAIVFVLLSAAGVTLLVGSRGARTRIPRPRILRRLRALQSS